jgi:peptidoglycan/xylan/chitin deacetylase (PgdA/CDA1 family)
MRSVLAILVISAVLGGTAAASECANPDALGVSRTVVVDPAEHRRIGSMQYDESLPLADHEVVLTFDDGPLPPYTNRVLQALSAECVKATFFLVGRMSRAFPQMVRTIYNEGHTIGTHSQNHPRIFTRLPQATAEQEIGLGIEAATAALGDPRALAPFFRFPGLGRSDAIEAYLTERGIMTWSADFPADDWLRISPKAVMHRALDRLERKGKGVLLLHDIQPRTVLMLPELLRQLKLRGFHVVHVVPAGPDRPKSVTEPDSWVMRRPMRQGWPRIVEPVPMLPAPSIASFGWPHPFRIRDAVPMPEVADATAGAKPRRGPAWAPAPHVSLVRSNAPAPLTPEPAGTFADPPVDIRLPPLAEPVSDVVAGADVLAEMSSPETWVPRPARKPAPRHRPKVASPPHRPATVKPPMPLRPHLVEHRPAGAIP